MVFTGTYEHSIDAKHRLAIPADVRTQIEGEVIGRTPEQPVVLYVTLGEGKSLAIYTGPAFERRANDLDNSPLDAEELLAYERLMFSLARRVELDKQGRILLPEQLLNMSGLGQDVVLIGVKDHLEIRDRQAWRDYVAKMLAERPQILMNPRRAMRRPEAPPAGGN